MAGIKAKLWPKTELDCVLLCQPVNRGAKFYLNSAVPVSKFVE